MDLHWIDWSIIFFAAISLCVLAYKTKKYTTSTSDFLAANRCAGRYLLTMAEGLASMGAISIIGMWQVSYKTGLAATWWSGLSIPVTMIMMLTGWVIYRYRETRAMTIAQFFEMRYSKRFRVTAGIVCWSSGIINFGIFPAVGANFFVFFCRLPESYMLFGLSLSTYHSLIILLVGIALYFTFMGGQIAVIITDFFQSAFFNIVFIAILILILIKFPLIDIFEGLQIAEEGKSMVNPFDAGKADFNPWYYIIGVFGIILNRLSWQGSQAYNCSAKSPHEAKMAGVLSGFRWWAFLFALTLIPLVAYMIMHHPNYSDLALKVTQMIEGIKNEQVRDQMLVPVTMTLYMPIGLTGAFIAAMFAAFISTHDTYLHSWGSIFIQDVVVPIRKTPFSPKQHIWALRISILFVGVFICIFSSFFRQTTHILYFFALTAAVWLGGAGVVIIGGLYTKRGNTVGAYVALIAGSIIAVGGMILEQLYKSWYGTNFFVQAQYMYMFFVVFALLACIIAGRIIQLNRSKLTGYLCAVTGFIIIGLILFLIEKSKPDWALLNSPWLEHRFFLTGQWIYFIAMASSFELYFVFSFFCKPVVFDLDKMLHRGKWQIASDHGSVKTIVSPNVKDAFSIRKVFGITEEFTVGDKLIYAIAIVKSLILFMLFLIMTICAILWKINDKQWAMYHYFFLLFMISSSFIIAVWFFIGGTCDMVGMFKKLKTAKRDFDDDGRVVDHHNLGEDVSDKGHK